MTFHFDNCYARLPDGFFARVLPTPVAAPRLLKLNIPLARELGLDPDALASPEGVEMLAGNRLPPRCRADRGRLCRPSVRLFQSGTRRRPRRPARRDRHAHRRAPRHPAEGLRPDALLAARRRTRRARRPCCANTSSARPWRRSAFPTTRALAAVATGEPVYRETSCPVRCSRASPPATSGSARFSISPRAATGGAARACSTTRSRGHYPTSRRPPIPMPPCSKASSSGRRS